MVWINAAALGLLGGLVRALMGLIDAIEHKRKIIWAFFLMTLLESALIGGILGGLLNGAPLYNFLAGVGGTWLLDHAGRMFRIMPMKIGLK